MISERTVIMDNSKIEIEKVTIPDVKKPAGEGELAESELNKVSGGGYGYGNQDKYSGS
jgi:hypothetical protein